MGYIMRFISTDDRAISLPIIEGALQQIDSAYSITNIEVVDLGDLMFGNIRCAIIEINRPGEDIFEDDLDAFREMVQEAKNPSEKWVLETLDQAKAMVVVEALWEGEDSETVLAKIDPLWDWLFANYSGLSQADNEGFYDQSGLVVERKFML
jgi:hypothetical protein